MQRKRKPFDDVIGQYQANQEVCERFLDNVRSLFWKSKALAPYVHSMKWRIKDPEHLRDKIIRKTAEKRKCGTRFLVTPDNLFEQVTDIVGFRILHLYTQQVEPINKIVLQLLKDDNLRLIEGPIARTWDNEFKEYFKSIGMKTRDSPKMYTSVHYVFKANKKNTPACELQVRTLAEELWGEVDHTLNYPHETDNVACSEQIKVLARAVSSCTRLVNSIFKCNGGND
jgi:ppGpp synthetase/RelA/SpoT-type nucleotidyltranferase